MDPSADSSWITTSLQSLLDKHLFPSSPLLPSSNALRQAREQLLTHLPSHGISNWHTHLLSHITPALNASSLSPNYYGFVTGGCTPAALFGDVLASIYDQNVQVHLPEETVATEVERCALGMLGELLGLETGAWGASSVFTTGATASNVLGLGMGREWVLGRKMERNGKGVGSVGENGMYEVMKAAGVERVQIISTMPHSSIAKAASILGIGRANVISIAKHPPGPGRCSVEIDIDLLEEQGRKPNIATILAISAGEVNTGRFATDGLAQMQRLRDICDRHSIWMHVDGALGLFGRALTSPTDATEFRDIIRGCQGLELADSIAGDAHKLLNVPYDCGFYFCRHSGIAEEVFRNPNAAYLASASASSSTNQDPTPSPLHIGIENSRRFRALPVYTTLLAYGREGYTDMLRRQIRLARRVVAFLWDSAAYQVLPEEISKGEIVDKTFIIVLFRARDDEVNEGLVRRINATGKIYVSGTRWEGMPAARIAVANWQVDVERDYGIIEGVLQDVVAR